MAAAGRKRKTDSEESAKAEQSAKGFLGDFELYLHPAALSASRRNFFENAIAKNGGNLLSSVGGAKSKSKKVLVLIENVLVAKDKLPAVIDKAAKEFGSLGSRVDFVGLSWLSMCLEENNLVDINDFILRKGKEVGNESSKSSCAEITCEESSAPPSSYIERNKHKFVCARSSAEAVIENPNKHITDELEKLATAYKSTNDTWRAFGYQKAIAAIRNHPKAITSRAEAAAIPSVGRKMADKIAEILEDGQLRKVQEVCDSEHVRALELFTRVWGAGPSTADLWYRQGCRTLDDLREKATLNKHQVVGLRLFEDLDQRMSRAEAEAIYEYVKRAAGNIMQDLEVVACGSFRRGKKDCGDLDILITHCDFDDDDNSLSSLFSRLLDDLRATGFLTDDLTVQRDGRQRKYLGVCRLPPDDQQQQHVHRRLDIIVVPFKERAPALLYFTGSAHFNRSMRLLAQKMNMSLSEHALTSNVVRVKKEKINEGNVLDTPTEESIFEQLGLTYREPAERDH